MKQSKSVFHDLWPDDPKRADELLKEAQEEFRKKREEDYRAWEEGEYDDWEEDVGA